MLVAGFSRGRIFQYASENGWNLVDRQMDEYIKKANEMFRRIAASRTDRHTEVGKALARYEEFIRLSLENGDVRGAIMANAALVKLLGLEMQSEAPGPTKVEISYVNDWRPPLPELLPSVSDCVPATESPQEARSPSR